MLFGSWSPCDLRGWAHRRLPRRCLPTPLTFASWKKTHTTRYITSNSIYDFTYMLAPSPFLVHSLFAIGGWLLRGGVISCDCFLTIAGKAMITYWIFNKTSVINDVWNLVMSRGPEYCMQHSFDGRTDGLLPNWSHFNEVGSWCATYKTQNQKRHQKDSNTANSKSLLLSHSQLHTPQPNQCTKLLWGKLRTSGPLRIPFRVATYPLG